MRYTRKKQTVLGFTLLFVCGLFLLTGCNTTPTKPPATITQALEHIFTPTPTSTADKEQETTPVPTVTPMPTSTPTPTPKPTGTPGEVCFSKEDYFFTENTFVELSISSKKTGYITYTLDGSEPTATSALYTEPILLVTNTGDFPNVYSIRAKAWYDDSTVSDTYVHTYFLNETINSRYTTAIISINGEPSELTEGPDGILYGENYLQRGRESERKIYIEALTADGTPLFEQHAGVRIFGAGSRKYAVKSLKLYARKEYQKGKGTFGTTIFGSTTLDGTEPITKYDKLVLRAGGDDFQNAFLRDELMQRLAEKAGFAAYEASVPALVYINGNYHGLYWLHESYCDKYFQYRNGKSDGEYVVLEGSDWYKSVSGDDIEITAAKEFNKIYNKYSKADLTNDTTYSELCSLIDIENYIDYMALNIYGANYDWPQGNFRCFRYYAAEGESYGTGEKDGRWRFLMHDADISFGTYQSTKDAGAARNDLEEVLGENGHKRNSALLTALLKREDCKQYFIDKMLEYINGALSYESVCSVLDEMCSERDAELAYYFKHLDTLKEELKNANSTAEVYAKPSRTNTHIARIRSFAEQRPVYMLQYLEEFFGIELKANDE